MRFSVIIPVFNAEDRINRALNIIEMQNFKDYELITVCDSCVDNSAKICREYTDKVYEVNYGNDGLTRSYGLDMAAGEYVLFLDDDDWWLHDSVMESIDMYLKEKGEVDILQFGFYWKGKGAMLAQKRDGTMWPNVWSKAWKRSFIGDTRFPNIYSVSDLHFTNAMLSKSPSINFLEKLFVYYNYLRPGSISEKQNRLEIYTDFASKVTE